MQIYFYRNKNRKTKDFLKIVKHNFVKFLNEYFGKSIFGIGVLGVGILSLAFCPEILWYRHMAISRLPEQTIKIVLIVTTSANHLLLLVIEGEYGQ